MRSKLNTIRIALLAWLFTYLLIAFVSSNPVEAKADEVNFTLENSRNSLELGDTVQIDVIVDTPHDSVDAVQVFLDYNSEYIQPVDERGEFTNQIRSLLDVSQVWPFVLLWDIENQLGHIDIAVGRGSRRTGANLNGEITLAKLTFLVIRKLPSEGTAITFSTDIPRATKATSNKSDLTGIMVEALLLPFVPNQESALDSDESAASFVSDGDFPTELKEPAASFVSEREFPIGLYGPALSDVSLLLDKQIERRKELGLEYLATEERGNASVSYAHELLPTGGSVGDVSDERIAPVSEISEYPGKFRGTNIEADLVKKISEMRNRTNSEPGPLPQDAKNGVDSIENGPATISSRVSSSEDNLKAFVFVTTAVATLFGLMATFLWKRIKATNRNMVL